MTLRYHFTKEDSMEYDNLRYQVVEIDGEFGMKWVIASSNYKHMADKTCEDYNTKRKFGVRYTVVDSQT